MLYARACISAPALAVRHLVTLRAPTYALVMAVSLYRSGQLEFSSREPGLNVYEPGGEFLAHKDHQALTLLVPLSESTDFEGGGARHAHRAVQCPSVLRARAHLVARKRTAHEDREA